MSTTPDIDETSRAVITHETSHLFATDVPDRYGARQPFRGDVRADARRAAEYERFVIERVAGPGRVRFGDSVLLRAHNGKYRSVDPATPNFVNTEDRTASGLQRFTLRFGARSGVVVSGSPVALRSSLGRFMSAEQGGNSAVTARGPAVREWETFEMRKEADAGVSFFSSGDVVSLRTLTGFFVGAVTNGRVSAGNPDDVRRGYVWASARVRAEGSTMPATTTHPVRSSGPAGVVHGREPPAPRERRRGAVLRSSGVLDQSRRRVLAVVAGQVQRRLPGDERRQLLPSVISAAAPDVPPNILAQPIVLNPGSSRSGATRGRPSPRGRSSCHAATAIPRASTSPSMRRAPRSASAEATDPRHSTSVVAGARSAAGDGRQDRQLASRGNGRVQSVEEANVLAAEVDVDEPA